MTEMKPFFSALASTISRYLALKRSLGRSYKKEEAVLRSMDDFLVLGPNARQDLTTHVFEQWGGSFGHLSSNVRRSRMQVIRNLCLYRRRVEPSCYVPDPDLFPRATPPAPPYIFKAAEIKRLLQAVNSLWTSARGPLRREIFRLAIVLLYTAGLRRGELLKLTVGDYDSLDRKLRIRETKYYKSRWLPLSDDASRELDEYLRTRRLQDPALSAGTFLIQSPYRPEKSYTGVGLSQTLRQLHQVSGIRTSNGRCPRVHDFRHTFAVHALLRWYRLGIDTQAKLPYLSAYMGHVSIASTEYYLPFVDELSGVASDCFLQAYGDLIVASPDSGGVQ